MRNPIINLIPLLVFIVMAHPSSAQYFNNLYDVDSTADWGIDIFYHDGNNPGYRVFGRSDNFIYTYSALSWLNISGDGNTVYNRKYLDTSQRAELYIGMPGAVKQLPDGGYILPFNPQTYYPGDTIRSAVGLMRLDSLLDTVFIKVYTDTSVNFDIAYDLAVMPDGGYILAGGRQPNTMATHYKCLLMRTDSMGNLIWAKTYGDPAKDNFANTVEALDSGRILMGAMRVTDFWVHSDEFYDNQPWFVIVDGSGNKMRDTIYPTRYGGGGSIRKDINGGYMHWGYLDSFLTPDYLSYDNFPGYVAHLDTNFKVQWFHLLGGIENVWGIWEVKELCDSNYLVVARNEDSGYNGNIFSSLTKLNKAGDIIWHNKYYKDTVHWGSYIANAIELPDHNIVFTGSSVNDSAPGTFSQDVWLVHVDSNGCEIPGCSITQVPPITRAVADVSLFPNPTFGNFTIQVPRPGSLAIFNMQGVLVSQHSIREGTTDIILPRNISPGIYICRYTPSGDNNAPVVLRLVVG